MPNVHNMKAMALLALCLFAATCVPILLLAAT